MKFDCKEITISDEEIGCTLVLPEKEEEDNYGGGMPILRQLPFPVPDQKPGFSQTVGICFTNLTQSFFREN